MVTCNVTFDKPNGVYFSGQTLGGFIELKNDKSRNIRGVSLKIEGCAKCKWTESEGNGKNRRTITYSGREDYLDTFSYLVGNYDVGQTELSPGVHRFTFNCVLPAQIPTSFESKYGYIRYQLKIELERPWKFDIKFNFAFTVIKSLDLNYESPALRSPLRNEISKTFFLGFGSKILFIQAEIPISGFVSGQSVMIAIKINNETNVDVEEIKVCLKQIILYNSQTPRRKTRERIETAAEVRHAGIAAKSKGFVNSQLTIPPIPPTNVAFCRILQISYIINIVAKVGGIHRSPNLGLPITIGTVPLQQYQSASYASPALGWNTLSDQPSTSSGLPVAPPYESMSSYSTTGPMPSTDMPPPSYQEATGMSSTDNGMGEGLNDEKPFSPMYPTYGFSVPPAQQPLPVYQKTNRL